MQYILAGSRLRAIRTGGEASEFSQYINAPDVPSLPPDWVVEGTIFEPLDNSNDALTLILIDR